MCKKLRLEGVVGVVGVAGRRGGRYLNEAELMPDYGVKTRSISVREYLKTCLLLICVREQ